MLDPSSPTLTFEQRMQWLSTARIFMLETYGYPFFPDLDFDAERTVLAAKRQNANAIRFMTSLYYSYIHNPIYRPHPSLNGRDLLKELIEAGKKHGVYIIPYMNIGHPLPWYQIEGREEWLKVNHEGNVIRGYHTHEFLWECCPNGPYRESIKQYLKHILSYEGIASMYFDGIYFGFNSLCHCPSCKKQYLEETGSEMPAVKTGLVTKVQVDDWDNPLFHQMVRWVTQAESKLMAELNGIIKANSTYPLVFNRGWTNHQVLRGRYSALVAEADGAMNERARDYLGNLENCLMQRSAGKMVWNYAGMYDSHSRVLDEGLEATLEAAATMAASATVIWAYGNRAVYDTEGVSSVAPVFKFAEKNEETLQGLSPVPYAAIAYSEATAEWYGKDDPYERYTKGVRGAFQMLHDRHLQVTPLNPPLLSNVDALKAYKVLCLPNVVCMNDAEAKAIRQYVAEGGAVVASYKTSLYDEEGRPRGDFLLKDLFGVSYVDRPQGKIMEDYLCPTDKVQVDAAKRTFMFSSTKVRLITDSAEVWSNHVHKEDIVGPGIVMNRYGKGRVIYCVGNYELEWHDVSGRRPDIRNLYANLVRWAADSRPPVEVTGPMTLTVNVLHKPGCRVVYIINRAGDPHTGRDSRIENIVSQNNIEVCVPNWKGDKAVDVNLLNSEQTIRAQVKDGDLHFVVPSIHVFEAALIKS